MKVEFIVKTVENFCETFGVSVDEVVKAISKEEKENVKLIIKPYSDKSFSIEGDTKAVKDKLNSIKNVSWNTSLKKWVAANTSKKDLLALLKKEKIAFEEVDEKIKPKSKITEKPSKKEESSDSEEEAPKKSKSTKKEESSDSEEEAPTKAKSAKKVKEEISSDSSDEEEEQFLVHANDATAKKVMKGIMNKFPDNIKETDDGYECSTEKVRRIIEKNMGSLKAKYEIEEYEEEDE